VRQGLKNQDAIDHYVSDDGAAPVILAVADGHGSAKSFRSDIGAGFAVKTAVEVCRAFLEGIRGTSPPPTPSVVKNDAEQQIPRDIFRSWRQRVTDHVAENPLTPEELDGLGEQAGEAARKRAANPEQRYVAYGSTLLVAMLTDEFLICFQLGDGDILAVYDGTDEAGRVIPKDETLIANETTSLCQDDGFRHFRCQFKPLNQDCLPGLVLLSTDGYCNSFASPGAFLKVGTDYLNMLRSDGAEEIGKNLSTWLDETSRNGSGDDITVGIIYRRQPRLEKAVVRQAEAESAGSVSTAEAAIETNAASDPAAPAGESAVPVSESPIGDPAEHGSKGLLKGLIGSAMGLFGKRGE